MFKRANKITALLVAAASVISIVPAMAATRIGTRDGHIKEGAIAFQDGKYLYDGYRTNDDDNGIYYNNGTQEKEKFNEDLRDYTLVGKYGTKYVYAKDGNDQYLIDLTTGKIVSDETPEDKADTVKSKLKSTLKKTDRYSNTNVWNTVDLSDENGNSTRVLGNQFGEVWYRYAALGDKSGQSTSYGQQAQKASFRIKLPTSGYDYDVAVTANPATKIHYTGTSLSDLRNNMLTAIKADTIVTDVFDKDSIAIVGNEIVGYAKNAGELSVTDQALLRFQQKYVPGTPLSAVVNGSTLTAAPGDLNLTTISSVSSSNNSVAAGSFDASGVKVLGINPGTATITVSDTTSSVSKTATIAVEVTSTAGAKVVKATEVKAYVSPEVKQAAVSAVIAGSLTPADYVNAGLTAIVDTTGANAKKLTMAEAKTAITNYINTGKVGTYTIADETQLKNILQQALDLKLANADATAQVVIYRGQNLVGGVVGSSAYYTGYVNENGKYIDVSSLANIYVYSEVEGKTVKVKEYNKENSDYHITVGLADLKTLAQDKDYIYALATVQVVEGNQPVKTQYFVQKIAKAQGDTKDGAYLPKSVDSYQIDNKSIFDNGDSQVAYNLLRNFADSSVAGEDGYTTTHVTAKNGVLYVTGVKDDNSDKDKIKMFKIVLKKDKNDLVSGVSKGKYDGKDVDAYIAKKDGDADADLKDGTRGTAVSYDIDGNTWFVSKGTITKFTGTDKKDMYTCDRTFDHIDVYDEKNLIVWDTDSDVYSNVAEGTKVTQGESTAVTPAIVTGWVKGTDGTWTFNDATGTKVVSKWINVGGTWYYLKADGIMATGWYNDNGAWYYLNPASGAMSTGWVNDNGTWYYLNGSGAMVTGWVNVNGNWYYLTPNAGGPQGSMKTGWINDNGTWYYLSGSGAMLANTTVDGYRLGASGAWIR